MTDLWKYLKNCGRPIVLYGTGNGADKVVKRLESDGVRISGVFSSAGFKKNRLFYGHSVCDYATLKERFGEMIILVCFGSDRAEVIQNIKRLRKTDELYVPDVPVCGEEIFDTAFARENAQRIKAVYDMLADDASRKVFEAVIRFKLSGDPELLFGCESERSEDMKLLSLGDSESFLDLGAFTGDTVEEFIGSAEGYNDIVAVEPDARNYRKLCENTALIPRITCINSAVSAKVGSIAMSKQHGRGISQTAKTVEIPCTTLDCIAADRDFTYIKMDTEGAELDIIRSGSDTIRRLTPKMRIACYHRSQDIFEIPLAVKEIVPGYRVYLRHNPCLPAWDTDFIFVK